jgi:hypothetical protein
MEIKFEQLQAREQEIYAQAAKNAKVWYELDIINSSTPERSGS